jgi:hypothetical protein
VNRAAGTAAGRARADAIRSIIGDVVVAAVDAAQAGGVIVLRDWTPEGELAYEWLVAALGEARVWRGASLASNVHVPDREDAQILAAWRFSREHGALIADPSSKTALLLGGSLPPADLFPLGDLYASQVAVLAGGWSVPDRLRPIIEQIGAAALDESLMRLVEAREAPDLAFAGIDRTVADELTTLYERGRSGRLRRWLVPKLTARTLGIDLFD